MASCNHSAFIYAVLFTPHVRPTPWGQPRVMSTDSRENRQCIHTSRLPRLPLVLYFDPRQSALSRLSFLRTIVLVSEIDGVRLPGPGAC